MERGTEGLSVTTDHSGANEEHRKRKGEKKRKEKRREEEGKGRRGEWRGRGEQRREKKIYQRRLTGASGCGGLSSAACSRARSHESCIPAGCGAGSLEEAELLDVLG